MTKVRFQPQFDKDTADKIKTEAEKTGAKPSPYIAKIVTAHIAKQETSHQPKKEYGVE